jgi:hypothetical protein
MAQNLLAKLEQIEARQEAGGISPASNGSGASRDRLHIASTA